MSYIQGCLMPSYPGVDWELEELRRRLERARREEEKARIRRELARMGYPPYCIPAPCIPLIPQPCVHIPSIWTLPAGQAPSSVFDVLRLIPKAN